MLLSDISKTNVFRAGDFCTWHYLFSVTSRKPKVDERDGQMYSFMTRSEMECDIKNGRFLEHGEYDGNLYGTKISSIHEVMETGKICILDVNPQVEATRFLLPSLPLHFYCFINIWGILCPIRFIPCWSWSHQFNLSEGQIVRFGKMLPWAFNHHIFAVYFCKFRSCSVMLFPPLKALKVLRTSEFLPYVVFIEAPDYEVLKAMNRSAIELGVVTKQLTVSILSERQLKTQFPHSLGWLETGGSAVFTIGHTAMTSSGNIRLSSPL